MISLSVLPRSKCSNWYLLPVIDIPEILTKTCLRPHLLVVGFRSSRRPEFSVMNDGESSICGMKNQSKHCQMLVVLAIKQRAHTINNIL